MHFGLALVNKPGGGRERYDQNKQKYIYKDKNERISVILVQAIKIGHIQIVHNNFRRYWRIRRYLHWKYLTEKS